MSLRLVWAPGKLGVPWGDVPDKDAERVLHAAIEKGINLIDTADVYGDGRSEKFIAKVLSETKTPVYVATKAGRRLQPHTADGYNREILTAFVERSLQNLLDRRQELRSGSAKIKFKCFDLKVMPRAQFRSFLFCNS